MMIMEAHSMKYQIKLNHKLTDNEKSDLSNSHFEYACTTHVQYKSNSIYKMP